jgi:hypothetical protein
VHEREQSPGVLDRRLRRGLAVRGVLAAALLLVLAVRVWRGDVGAGWAALAVFGGAALGLVFARATRIGWDDTETHVIGRSDAVGVAVLALHLLYVVAIKGRLVGVWVDNATATAALGLAVTAGGVAGQIVSPLVRIRRLLAAGRQGPG